jgi:hypothetical protein
MPGSLIVDPSGPARGPGKLCAVTRRARHQHRPLALDSSHWRADGQPKVRYRTRTDALVAADERSREVGSPLGVYACAFCSGWHMGRREGRDPATD